MKKLTAQLRKILPNAWKEIEQAENEVKTWEKNRSLYEKSYFNSRLAEKQEQLNAVVERWVKAITEAVELYKGETSGKNQIRGEELTADAALLSSGLPLSKADLQAIFDRSAGNYTMQVLSMRYADQHQIDIGRVFFTPEQTNQAADNLGSYAKNALTRPEYREIWGDEQKIAKIEAPALI